MAKLFAWKRVCVCVRECMRSEVQALPTLLPSGEAERLFPPSPLASLFGVFLRDLCPLTPFRLQL